MEKKIIITVAGDSATLSSEGEMTHIDIIGYLRFFEKKLFIDALNANKRGNEIK